MLAKSKTVSAVLRAKPDIADQRTEADAIVRGLPMLFQIIFFLRPVECGHRDDLAHRRCGCARAIAVPVERLLLMDAPQDDAMFRSPGPGAPTRKFILRARIPKVCAATLL
jgi:hypothetical protein